MSYSEQKGTLDWSIKQKDTLDWSIKQKDTLDWSIECGGQPSCYFKERCLWICRIKRIGKNFVLAYNTYNILSVQKFDQYQPYG